MIAKRIISLMGDKNLSSKQFAEELNISPSIVTHITSGRNNPSLDIVLKIKNKYPEVDLDWLLLGASDTPIYLEQTNNPPIPPQKEWVELPFKNNLLNEEQPASYLTKQSEIKNLANEKIVPKPIEDELVKVILFYKNGKFEVFEQ